MLDSSVPENWPNEIKQVLNKLTEEDRGIVVDHMTRSYMAGYFDGEGSVVNPTPTCPVPMIGSQDTECLMLYQKKYGGNILLQYKKGSKVPVYMGGKKVPGVFLNVNRDSYMWTMTDRRRGRASRGYILKTKFLLEMLPYQRSQLKIRQSIKAVAALGWSARVRWEHLIPRDVDVSLPEDKRTPVDEFFR